MTDVEAIDFFRDNSMIEDPYPYFDALRGRCPIVRENNFGVMMVTGYDEAVAVYNDPTNFSSCNSVSGPFPGISAPMEGDDVSDVIEAHRDELPFFDMIPTLDPPVHTDHRALLMRLLTPKRLKENEDSMWNLADQQLNGFIERGKTEFVADYASPFTMYVVGDLLGVPTADHPRLRVLMGEGYVDSGGDAVVGSTSAEMLRSPLEFIYDQFSGYIEDRRRTPRGDVLTSLATTTFPDGSLPPVGDAARVAVNLFSAGQETTVRLLGTALQYIAEDPELQQLLRDHRDRIPNFIEEVLRIESPVKGDFRLTRRTTKVGGVQIPAGTTVMVLNGAANRDPSHFECPGELRVDRPNAREHLAFGRGIHSCPGGPLARAETRISLERVLDRMADIRIDEEFHGPPGARRYDYFPTFILRGLMQLHLEFSPIP